MSTSEYSHTNCQDSSSFEKAVEKIENMDVTESSSSETSPALVMPNLGDLTLEKDIDRKTLKQELYNLKLRIYYMEQREKNLKGEDDYDIYQKYFDLQSEFEKLSKNVDEKDELLLKAQKVTTYLREEKEKLLFEFQDKEKFYKEHIQQLEKELEDMKLCNPKFGLHSTVFMSGDSADSFSIPVNENQKRINNLEFEIRQLNVELENLKASNDQLEKTANNLQRKISLYNKEITDLNTELIIVQKERDLAIEDSARNSERFKKVEKENEKLEAKLAKIQQSENVNASVSSSDQQQIEQCDQETDDQVQSSKLSGNTKVDKNTAALVRHLLTENKQTNSKLRKLKEEFLLIYELCSSCPNCVKEKRLKKASIINLRQKLSVNTSEDDKNDANCVKIESENDQFCESLTKIKEIIELRSQIKEKDKIIKQLRIENKKCTYNLQELVNKELWDKNREIEKLNKLCEKQKHEIDIFRKQSDRSSSNSNSLPMRELQPSFVRNYNCDGKENIFCLSDDVKLLKEELRNCLEEKKLLLQKITVLESKITSDEEQKAQVSLVNNLRLECVKHREDFEEAEKARKDAYNACALLTNRLEELACFLESLLAHDSTGLNSKRRELLKQAIERSREISKSFSCTFVDVENSSTIGTKFESSIDLCTPILPDYSEINLSFSCGDDDDEENDEIGNRTVQPYEEDNKNSVFNQMIRKSNDFVSTEDSDAGPVRKSVMFVNDLNSSGELVICSGGIHRLQDDITTETTDISRAENICNKCCTKGTQESGMTSSVALSSNEERKHVDFDTESESYSKVNWKVSRPGITSTGTKLRPKRLRPEPCYSTDSDGSVPSDKRCIGTSEVRLMHRRIQHLERINDSLRRDLKQHRLHSQQKNTVAEKTDMEKIREKTKLRNLLNKINLENCVDVDKYRDGVEFIRKNLRELSKHLKSKKCDKLFISIKLKEVMEHFELSELCCSRLNQHLEDAKIRCEVLTGLLEETQSKFERVMVDLHTTKLAYNTVILEHEQNMFKYKQSELAKEQLLEKLKCSDEQCHNLECDLKETRAKTEVLEQEMKDNKAKTLIACDCEKLKDLLDKASKRIAELESFVANNDRTLEELNQCKQNVQKLKGENEKLLSDLDELLKYKSKVEEYECQLNTYKKNCEKLELELFEKDSIEKLYKEQCAKLEEEIIEKNSLHNTLKLRSDELAETRTKIEELENKVAELNELVKEKESIIIEHDHRFLELKSEKESSTLLLKEFKEKIEFEISEKIKNITELKDLLKISEGKTKKFEEEINLLRSLLNTCEEEKREFRSKIEKQVDEYECMKKQHEQKMKHLLAQIVAYRTEEESSLAAHRQLVEQIEEAQLKKEQWKKSIQDWKEKYEELKKEKEQIEEKLQFSDVHSKSEQLLQDSFCSKPEKMEIDLMKCSLNRDWFVRETELRYQLDVATLTTSHVILEWTRLANEKLRLQRELHRRDKPLYVNHLENIKSQLENRVKELESANKELENRLKRFKTNKISPSDFDLTSEESSRASSPLKKDFPFDFSSFPTTDFVTYKSGTTTTGYSSSLPSSPNHEKCASPLSNSVPNSPVLNKDNRSISQMWLASENVYDRIRNSIYEDVLGDVRPTNRLVATPVRKNSSENSVTSPDLGIDSDHGRNSSFDFDTGTNQNKVHNEIGKLEEENKMLKRELSQTRKELEETLSKLTTLNKNKKKMEKAIFKQIYETKHILQRARVNLEDGNGENNAS